MLISAKTYWSDGTVASETYHDLDAFLRDNQEGIAKDRGNEIARTLRRRGEVYRIDVMGGMYVDVSHVTLADAKAICRSYGHSLTHRPEYGEYRVAPLSGTPKQREDRAAYTDDLADAIGTARNQRDWIE